MAAKKSTSTKAPADPNAAGKKPNAAFLKPLQPSPDLAKVVGGEPKPRTEVVSKLWAYIREHNLQDPQNKKVIKTDEALKAIFDGRDSVDMFEMNKYLKNHLS